MQRYILRRLHFDIDSLVRYIKPSLTGAAVEPPALDRITTTP